MSQKEISNGVMHKVPEDLRKVLNSDSKTFSVWNSLTPLARNEWICWVVSVKREETRREHIQRVKVQLKEGKRRPCCWIGCIHRTDKAISPSIRGILKRVTKSRK